MKSAFILHKKHSFFDKIFSLVNALYVMENISQIDKTIYTDNFASKFTYYYYYYYYYYYLSVGFFTLALVDDLSLEAERQQVSLGLQDFSQYFAWS